MSASISSKTILFIWACSSKDKKTESRRAVIEPLLTSETRLTRRFALKPGLGMQGLLAPIVGNMNLYKNSATELNLVGLNKFVLVKLFDHNRLHSQTNLA
jgi:hypothetical protein